MSPAPRTRAGWLLLAGRGCSLWHPPSASGKLKFPANLSSGTAALAAGARSPPAQRQRMDAPLSAVALAGRCQPRLLLGRERRQQSSSCLLLHLTLWFSLTLLFFFFFFVPPPGICQADGAELCSGSAGQSHRAGCRGKLCGHSPSPPAIKARQGDGVGGTAAVATLPGRPSSAVEGWRCALPGAQRQQKLPITSGSSPKEGILTQKAASHESSFRHPQGWGGPGAECPPAHRWVLAGWVLLRALPACLLGDVAPRNPFPSTATTQAC